MGGSVGPVFTTYGKTVKADTRYIFPQGLGAGPDITSGCIEIRCEPENDPLDPATNGKKNRRKLVSQGCHLVHRGSVPSNLKSRMAVNYAGKMILHMLQHEACGFTVPYRKDTLMATKLLGGEGNSTVGEMVSLSTGAGAIGYFRHTA